jgi:hypothetical protein
MIIREFRGSDVGTLAGRMRPAYRADFEKKCRPEELPDVMARYLEQFSNKWIMADGDDPVVLVAVTEADRYKIGWGFVWLAASEEIEGRVRDFLITSDRLLDMIFDAFPKAPGLFTWVDPHNPKSVNYLTRVLRFTTGVTVQGDDGEPSLEMLLEREAWLGRPRRA